ncbi:cell division cycle protein 123-like protein [Moniliophthora roreri MCA 2997]|uniref:Cell division cycle protein 123-like protein n=2 Tax=Moniliophthora roreri TaxID=221103 RepID=V2XQ25_MONRO|nr:cell division cycle protein 123-like protein [Moniliophthora roreri MCA 2997]KAI3607354.1 cell division cycle protein 123-like protein [Moniliophthora roreri]
MALISYPKSYILDFQFSSWYPKFRDVSIKSTIIKPLSKDFRDYLNADGIFVPKGSEDELNKARIVEEEEAEEDDDEAEETQYSFPELDAKIRETIVEYGAVFPKLNFSSPKDASWILPASAPLKCTSPADVYMLLKSSDFINHDLDTDNVFEGCETPPSAEQESYELELVLRKWYSIERSREMRCFVRRNRLIAVSQRDTNYYNFLNDPVTKARILDTTEQFWKTKIQPIWVSSEDYIFDVLLTRDLSRAHIVDFNPYASRTDPLLFTYDELQEQADKNQERAELRVIDSRSHPAANVNSPANQHNMIPFEALSMSSSRNIQEFAGLWEQSIKENMQEDVE